MKKIEADVEVKIRRAIEKEIEEILKIEQKEIYPELTLKQMQDWEEGEEPFYQEFVAEVDNEIVGSVTLEIRDVKEKEVVAELLQISVEGKAQKMGVGTKLLRTSLAMMEKRCSKEGFRLVGLIVQTGTDEATGFYEKIFPIYQKKVFPKTWEDGEGMVFYFFPLL